MKPDDSAFPVIEGEAENFGPAAYGLSVRDYIAIKAMAGILASGRGDYGPSEGENVALAAYKSADALIRRSQKPQE